MIEKTVAYPVVSGNGKNVQRIGWMNLDNNLQEDAPAVAQYLDANFLTLLEEGKVELVAVTSRAGQSFLQAKSVGGDRPLTLFWFNAETGTEVDPHRVLADIRKGSTRIESFQLGEDYSELYNIFGIKESNSEEVPF